MKRHRVIAESSIAIAFAVSPVALVAALATLLGRDYGDSEGVLGWSVAMFFLTSAVASVPGGHLADYFPARTVLLLGAACTFASILALAIWSSAWSGVVLCLAIGGIANGITQPATNRAVAGLDISSRSVAFGIKQAAIPAGYLVAGLAVPLLATRLGWRPAMVVVGATFLLTLVGLHGNTPGHSLPRATWAPSRSGHPVEDGRLSSSTSLAVMGLGMGLGSFAAISASAFTAQYGVASGLSPSQAGTLLAGGSLCAIAARLGFGWLATGWTRRRMHLVAILIGVGALGHIALALSRQTWVLVLGAFLALGAGWGWSGVFLHEVVERHPVRPAVATGAVQVGVFLGGVAGPFSFGMLVATAGYLIAWLATAAAGIIAAALLVWETSNRGPDVACLRVDNDGEAPG